MTALDLVRPVAMLAALLSFCVPLAGAQDAPRPAATIEDAAALVPAPANKTTPCGAPSDLARLDYPLARASARVAAGQPLTIVAIGSSSTAGAGASRPDLSYPSRLASELKLLYPRLTINVLNRGVNGETADQMLARFDEMVLGEKPDVVIWQVGSNSLLRSQPIAPAGELIRQGLKKLKAAGVDIILMNPQYAPRVIANPHTEEMVTMMGLAAKEANVQVFQRYAVMRYWKLTEGLSFDQFLSTDDVHMNDWSYGCVAKLLASAMADAIARPTLTAGRPLLPR